MLVLSVNSGEEVIETLAKQLSDAGVTHGAIVALVGAVDACAISNMPADDAKRDIITEFAQPFELSGTGEINDGRPHVHCVVSGEGNSTVGGHLHWARVESWFVRAYVVPLP